MTLFMVIFYGHFSDDTKLFIWKYYTAPYNISRHYVYFYKIIWNESIGNVGLYNLH